MNILEIHELKKNYGKDEILKGVNLEVSEGDFFALLGHNGAGKSTVTGIITSLVNKNSWKVRVAGIDIDDNFSFAKTYIWVVPQEFNFDVFSKVEDICIFSAGYYGISRSEAKKRAQYYLSKLNLWDKRDVKAKELSGGMKRRLMIARALMHEPKILILDEPTAGVDVELRKTMWEFIRELNQKKWVTIILTTHYLEEVEELCHNVAILSWGKIVHQGEVKQLLTSLDEEIFVLDLKDNLINIPKWLTQYNPKRVDLKTLELTLKAHESFNYIFSLFSQAWIEILSMRNKSNRLEQLFLRLAKK